MKRKEPAGWGPGVPENAGMAGDPWRVTCGVSEQLGRALLVQKTSRGTELFKWK